ncbi:MULTISPECIES: hypothetical protein [Vibrio]|nr:MULTISPECIES: hypothetical protein [Vibrio]
MLRTAFVRLVVGGLLGMAMVFNAVYFLPLVLLMNTHRRELFSF